MQVMTDSLVGQNGAGLCHKYTSGKGCGLSIALTQNDSLRCKLCTQMCIRDRYYQEGHFAEGSMGPKVLAAMRFVENSGSRAIITCREKVVEALRGHTGTIIVA